MWIKYIWKTFSTHLTSLKVFYAVLWNWLLVCHVGLGMLNTGGDWRVHPGRQLCSAPHYLQCLGCLSCQYFCMIGTSCLESTTLTTVYICFLRGVKVIMKKVGHIMKSLGWGIVYWEMFRWPTAPYARANAGVLSLISKEWNTEHKVFCTLKIIFERIYRYLIWYCAWNFPSEMCKEHCKVLISSLAWWKQNNANLRGKTLNSGRM